MAARRVVCAPLPGPPPPRAAAGLLGNADLDSLKIRVELALGQVDDAGDVGLRGGAEEIGQAGGHLQARGGALNGRVGLSQHLILHPARRPPATTAITAPSALAPRSHHSARRQGKMLWIPSTSAP